MSNGITCGLNGFPKKPAGPMGIFPGTKRLTNYTM